MEKIEQARWLVKAFRHLKHETTLWARSGDNEAAKDLMSIIATETLLLKSLGYRLSDNGQLVKHRPLIGIEGEQIDLAIKASMGDATATKHLLELMAQ